MECDIKKCGWYDPSMTDNCNRGEPPNVEKCRIRTRYGSLKRSTELPCSAKSWQVTRWVKEEFTAFGETRDDAIKYLGSEGSLGPHTITMTKQTCVAD